MEISDSKNLDQKGKTKTDNLILALFAYYLMSIPIALVIAGLVYPLLGNLSFVLFILLSLIFLFLTFRLQKLNDFARIWLLAITVFLLIGSLFFPFVIPTENNFILSKVYITYHSMSIADYVFYVLGVDGSFLIFGLFLVYILGYDKNTLMLFR